MSQLYLNNTGQYFAIVVCIGIWVWYGTFGCIRLHQSWEAAWKELEPYTHPELDQQQKVQLSIVELVRALRTRGAKEPKDKSFAFQAILARLNVWASEMTYENSVGKVYTDLYTRLLERYPTMLNLLLDGGRPVPDAPSWVPDWQNAAKREWLPSSYTYEPLSESADSFARLFEILPGQVLRVKGTWAGEVVWCSPNIELENLSPETNHENEGDTEADDKLIIAMSALHDWLARVMQQIPDEDAGSSESSSDLSSQVSSESSPHAGPSSSSNVQQPKVDQELDLMATLSAASDLVRVAITTIAVQDTSDSASSESLDSDATGDETFFDSATFRSLCDLVYREGEVDTLSSFRAQDFLAERPVVRSFMEAIGHRFAGKRVGFTTWDPETTGTGSVDMRPGDRVAIVAGVSAPLILRLQSSGRYLVVGHAFVEPLMQLCTSPDDEEMSYQDIYLE